VVGRGSLCVGRAKNGRGCLRGHAVGGDSRHAGRMGHAAVSDAERRSSSGRAPKLTRQPNLGAAFPMDSDEEGGVGGRGGPDLPDPAMGSSP
jgi:hypothetical protein